MTLTDSRTGELLGHVLLVKVTGSHAAKLGFDFPRHIDIQRVERPACEIHPEAREP